jgi:hypothetical protein
MYHEPVPSHVELFFRDRTLRSSYGDSQYGDCGTSCTSTILTPQLRTMAAPPGRSYQVESWTSTPSAAWGRVIWRFYPLIGCTPVRSGSGTRSSTYPYQRLLAFFRSASIHFQNHGCFLVLPAACYCSKASSGALWCQASESRPWRLPLTLSLRRTGGTLGYPAYDCSAF